jgi:hypothetical protein
MGLSPSQIAKIADARALSLICRLVGTRDFRLETGVADVFAVGEPPFRLEPSTGTRSGRVTKRRFCQVASCVEIHQVLPEGSLTPPRRSGSPGFWMGSWTLTPPAARAFL